MKSNKDVDECRWLLTPRSLLSRIASLLLLLPPFDGINKS
jgi:hypothetical protein